MGDDVKFLDAPLGQPLHFVKQLMHRNRRVAACDEWDGTEGAEPVAALRDLEIAVVAWGSQAALVGQVVAVGVPKVGKHAFPVKLAVEAVHFGQSFDKVGAETFRQASHDKQLADSTLFLGLTQLEDGVDRLLLGIGDKAARVHHHCLTIDSAAVVAHAVACCLQLTHQVLAVHKILGTAQ